MKHIICGKNMGISGFTLAAYSLTHLETTFYNEAQRHKREKLAWLNEYTHRIKKMDGIEKINTQRKINSLKYQIDNHENVYAEYYL